MTFASAESSERTHRAGRLPCRAVNTNLDPSGEILRLSALASAGRRKNKRNIRVVGRELSSKSQAAQVNRIPVRTPKPNRTNDVYLLAVGRFALPSPRSETRERNCLWVIRLR